MSKEEYELLDKIFSVLHNLLRKCEWNSLSLDWDNKFRIHEVWAKDPNKRIQEILKEAEEAYTEYVELSGVE